LFAAIFVPERVVFRTRIWDRGRAAGRHEKR
jgi:hypothetical protein